MWILLAVLPFIFILGYPYKLHAESLKLAEPVVIFTGNFWRATPWSLLFLGLAGLLLVLAFYLIQQPNAGWDTLLGALVVALPGLALGFILLRLHLSYWQHDRYASLTIYRNEQRAEYFNGDTCYYFALADVMHVTTYTSTSHTSRLQFWGHYSYQIFFLQDGTQLLVTCLLYSLLGPQELLPAIPHDVATRYICWLPGNEASNRPLH
jgi:hypothetical protein